LGAEPVEGLAGQSAFAPARAPLSALFVLVPGRTTGTRVLPASDWPIWPPAFAAGTARSGLLRTRSGSDSFASTESAELLQGGFFSSALSAGQPIGAAGSPGAEADGLVISGRLFAAGSDAVGSRHTPVAASHEDLLGGGIEEGIAGTFGAGLEEACAGPPTSANGIPTGLLTAGVAEVVGDGFARSGAVLATGGAAILQTLGYRRVLK